MLNFIRYLVNFRTSKLLPQAFHSLLRILSIFRSYLLVLLLAFFFANTSYKVRVRNFDNFVDDQEYRSCGTIIYFSLLLVKVKGERLTLSKCRYKANSPKEESQQRNGPKVKNGVHYCLFRKSILFHGKCGELRQARKQGHFRNILFQ